MKPQRILVAIDFSAEAEAARLWALAFARAFSAHLTLLFVADASDAAVEWMQTTAPGRDLNNKLKAAAEAQIAGVTARTPGATSAVRVGSPREAVLQVTRESDADLIVMGTHGRTGLTRLVLGSVAEHVVRHSAVPVLTVRRPQEDRETRSRDEAEGPRVKRVLFPTDFSSTSAAAGGWAGAIASAFQAELVALHVLNLSFAALAGMPSDVAMSALAAPDLMARLRGEAEGELREAARAYSGARRLLAEGVPREKILEVAAKEAVDLIVMGTHGRTGIGRVFFGSVAEHVVRQSPVPVLTVPQATRVVP